MEGGMWKPGRRRSREPLEEDTNRDGHWTREFTSRSEPWSVVEHWATDRGYRLQALKSNRRLYAKDADSRFYRRLVDIRQHQEGHRLTVSSWIYASFWARALNLFRIPGEMNPDPRGIFGVRIRRELGRDLNVLLERFKQHEILGSRRFHLLDQDMSTLLLAAGSACVAVSFLLPIATRIEIRQGLSNPLLSLLGRHATTVGSWLVGVLAAQSILARTLKLPLYRQVAAGGLFLVFSIASIFHFTRTAAEGFQTKFAYHCLYHETDEGCRALLNSLSAKERQTVLSRLRSLEKELAFGPAKPSR